MKKILTYVLVAGAMMACSNEEAVAPQENNDTSTLNEIGRISRTPGGTILMDGIFDLHKTSRILYNNNFWGHYKDGAASSQTMWIYNEDAWGVDLSANPHTGSNGDVKSYPSVILGSHYGNSTSSGSFPMKVSDVGRLRTNWSYTIHEGESLNASYDIWFNWDDTQRKDSRGNYLPNRYELMIWPYKKNQEPISYSYNSRGQAVPVGTVTVGGKRCKVYKGANYDSNGDSETVVLTFIPTSGTGTATNRFSANLGDFIKEAKKSKYGFIEDQHYLISAQAGFELCRGGKVETTDFDFSYN